MSDKVKLVYLDDEEQNLFSFQALFRRDFDVFTTTSAHDAANYLTQNRDVQIVFSDQKMPDVSGVEFFELIKEDFPDPVRILLTGYADIEAVIDAINRGQVYRYVTKPWDVNDLRICIENGREKYRRDKELKEKNSALEKANTELEKFVYSASHDLRAPIVTIKGVINLAKMEEMDEKSKSYFEMIEKSTNRLNDFVSNIVHYYQNMKSDEMSVEVDLQVMLNELIAKFKTYVDAFGIDVQCNVVQSHKFKTDANRLGMVLNNLISNAIKFSDSSKVKPAIEINVVQNMERAVIKIIDNGLGIEESAISNIFDMFPKSADKNVGAGVGLFITSEAIKKLKGKINVESKPGVGTKFIVEVPNLV
jgi:two-component system, sensor histidine kinase and response regulator